MDRIRADQAARIFPVKVDAVETVFRGKSDGAVHENLPLGRIQRHLRPLFRAGVPAADRDERLQPGIDRLERVEAAIAVVVAEAALATLVPGGEVVPGVVGHHLVRMIVHVGKPVAEVGAEKRVDVVNVKLSGSGPVEGPGAEVADQPGVGAGRRFGGGGSRARRHRRLVRDAVAHGVGNVGGPVAGGDGGVEDGAVGTLVLLDSPSTLHQIVYIDFGSSSNIQY